MLYYLNTLGVQLTTMDINGVTITLNTVWQDPHLGRRSALGYDLSTFQRLAQCWRSGGWKRQCTSRQAALFVKFIVSFLVLIKH